jgi:hypothetical protein
MPYSEPLKVFWFTPMRTASRSIFQLLDSLGNFSEIRSHNFIKKKEHLDYFFIVNVKNPYNRLTSIYHWSKKIYSLESDFEVWLPKKLKEEYEEIDSLDKTSCTQINLLDYFKQKNPDYIVKSESLEFDVRNIWFIKNNMSFEIENSIQEYIVKNGYNKEWDYVKPWQTYYTQKLADIVYHYMKDSFDFFEYDKNSWKDGTP